MERLNPCTRHLAALMMAGVALIGSAASARCPSACQVGITAAHHRCRDACTAGAAGKDCRGACKAERRTEKTTCRLAALPSPPSCGLADLYVATSGSDAFVISATRTRGRGSVSDPFVRIIDAVSRARAERAFGVLPAGDEIRIHVAPGTYVGSFDAAALQQHAEYEVLPIILNVPKLTLLGATVLVRDERGLPTSAATGGTIVAPDTALARNQYLVLVTRTADGAVGDGVTVDGFVFDGKDSSAVDPGATVFIDRVSGFDFRNNLVERSGFGVLTRLSSGTIEGNLLADNLELGAVVTGGSPAHPATLLIHGNRVTRNAAHGVAGAVAGWIKLVTDPGQNTLPLLEPLQTVFDRSDPEDLQNISDTLTITVSGNDVSDNGGTASGGTGIRLAGIWPAYAYSTVNVAQPLTSVLAANVFENTADRNGSYGVIIEAGDSTRFEPRRLIQNLALALDGNTLRDNGRSAALFTFTYWYTDIGLTPQIVKKFVEASTYAVTDQDGELSAFDYDNPVTDPVSGIVLGNSLIVNGVGMPHGTSITPP
jgi:hypothetical protein